MPYSNSKVKITYIHYNSKVGSKFNLIHINSHYSIPFSLSFFIIAIERVSSSGYYGILFHPNSIVLESNVKHYDIKPNYFPKVGSVIKFII